MNSFCRSVLLLGKIVTPDRPSAARVLVHKFKMDEKIVMYFKDKEFFNAEDPKQECQPGDYVLIRALENPKSENITHRVEKIIYPLGNIIDPVTGKRCAGTEYVEDIKRTREFFGTLPEYFKEYENTNKEHSGESTSQHS